MYRPFGYATLAFLVVTFPVLSLADVSGTATLTAAMGALNLDAGTTAASGGDLLGNGSTLTPQGSATAAVLPGLTGLTAYDSLTSGQLAIFVSSGLLSGAQIPSSSLAVGAILVVHTNGGNNAKLLVTSSSGGSLGLTYTTYGTTGGGGGGGNNAPSITAVENSATNLPPGLPNAAIAQGSLFVVKGANLGPTTFIQATAFPFTTTIGATSITVTVGATTVDCIMFYSLNRQVAAILPSKTPTGTGTLKLTYNGQSATAPITVVQNNIGIFTVSQTGTGDAVAFLNSDSQLITPTHAANADDVIVFWGTGLGPVTFDETAAVGTNQADMPNVPLHVYVGGQEASVVFRGRNGCCTSVDTVYIKVPHGLTGCAVSVLMQIGNLVSNGTSIAIAQNGRTCTPVNQRVPVGFTGTYKAGSLSLERAVTTTAISEDAAVTTKFDLAGGNFEKITYTTTPPTGSQLDINSYGSCSVSNYQQGTTPPSTGGATIVPLDAGSSIGVAGPGSFGNKTLAKSTVDNFILYSTQLDQTATTLVPGAYTFTGMGGAGADAVGAFTANYTLPPIFTWTNEEDIKAVDRATGVTVTWTGGNPSSYVTISGSSTYYGGTIATTIVASFTCTAKVSDTSFTVPPVVLLALPPSGSPNPGGRTVIPGSLYVQTLDSQSFGPPPGLDAAVIDSIFVYGNSVVYQ
jgi:uncharacterized protein (TIGR03437 family)